ncbi:methyltransferase family protein [Fodinicola feengrottensis]|uniref:methyltransferase family protein n=1 Tax=Fodinicola feengrottensis TaxID=435914 RepID=UPI0013D1D1CB|nr:hypothetical protein [Fodinicola feengrottensis]
MVTAHHISHVMHVIAELGIADKVAAKPQTAGGELADETGTDTAALARVLDAATAVGVFSAAAGRQVRDDRRGGVPPLRCSGAALRTSPSTSETSAACTRTVSC